MIRSIVGRMLLVGGVFICATVAKAEDNAEVPPRELTTYLFADEALESGIGSAVIGITRSFVANGEETFVDLSREHDLGYNELLAANPTLDPWVRSSLADLSDLVPGVALGVLPDLLEADPHQRTDPRHDQDGDRGADDTFPAVASAPPRDTGPHPAAKHPRGVDEQLGHVIS